MRHRVKAWLHVKSGKILLQDWKGRKLPYRAPGSSLKACTIIYHDGERHAELHK